MIIIGNWRTRARRRYLSSLRTHGFLSTTWISLVRRQLGEKINASIKGDIIANCGEDTYNMLMAAVAAERREQGEE